MEVVLGEETITKSDNAVSVSEVSKKRRRRFVGPNQLAVNAGTVVNPASRGAPAIINISVSSFYSSEFTLFQHF